MPTYHIIMICLFVLSIIQLVVYSFIKGKNYKVCSVAKTDFNSQLTDNDFQHIQKICDGWFRTSKIWGSLHYILATIAAARLDNYCLYCIF